MRYEMSNWDRQGTLAGVHVDRNSQKLPNGNTWGVDSPLSCDGKGYRTWESLMVEDCKKF